MNTPVDFEISRLLKEKGFDKICDNLWHYNSCNCIKITNKNSENLGFSAPTIAEAVMWFYEKYGIWINSTYMDDVLKFGYSVCSINTNTIEMEAWEFNSPTKAYEAGIIYTLKKLL